MYKKSSTNFETSRKIRPDLMRMIRSTRFDEDSTGFDGKDRFWHHTDICPPWVDDGIVRQSRMQRWTYGSTRQLGQREMDQTTSWTYSYTRQLGQKEMDQTASWTYIYICGLGQREADQAEKGSGLG